LIAAFNRTTMSSGVPGLHGKSDPVFRYKLGKALLDDGRHILQGTNSLGPVTARARNRPDSISSMTEVSNEHVLIGSIDEVRRSPVELLIGNVRRAHPRSSV